MTQKGGGEDDDTLSPDFLDFIVSLNLHGVDSVLVGGYAMGVHGVVRATGDIDFLYRATKRNVRRLCNAMIDFGAPPEIIDEETLLQPGIVTQFGQPPYRIDLLNEIDGVSFAQVWQGAELTSLEGQEVRVIGLKELKANKSATGRKKDREDVRRLNSKRR